MAVRFFEDSNAIESLRNSDFDAISAYGEVVDNSIQAEASNIKIKFSTTAGKRGYERIKNIAFGDDGHGMDAFTLNRCLQLGWSSRYNSRAGIGRFGVGMTLAAIHECKRVELFSKEKGKEWLWTFIDLGETGNGGEASIPEPIKAKVPAEYQDLVGDDSGTLVVWSKYDRQSANAVDLKNNSKIWMGRTYRYFIWDHNINLFVDGEEVKAIDPLYVRTEKTGFPNDPSATQVDDIVFSWKVDEFDAPKDSPKESPITIKMSLIDESFRMYSGSGGSAAAKDRFIDKNEGVSILRNKREVFYGHISYWSSVTKGKGWPSFENKDRFWGCEIHFDAILDRAFTVKNIKRGADPSRPLKEAIKEQISPTRQTFIGQIDKLWNQTKQEQREKEQGDQQDVLKRTKDHKSAESVVKKTPTDKTSIDETKHLGIEADKFIENKTSNYDEDQRHALKSLITTQPFTILEDTWGGTQFVEANFLGGKAVLRYNMSHPFFQHIYGLIESLDEDNCNSKQVAKDLKAIVDLMIIAHAKGEAKFPEDAEMTSGDFVQHLSANWGMYLQSYMRTWLKEKNNE